MSVRAIGRFVREHPARWRQGRLVARKRGWLFPVGMLPGRFEAAGRTEGCDRPREECVTFRLPASCRPPRFGCYTHIRPRSSRQASICCWVFYDSTLGRAALARELHSRSTLHLVVSRLGTTSLPLHHPLQITPGAHSVPNMLALNEVSEGAITSPACPRWVPHR